MPLGVKVGYVSTQNPHPLILNPAQDPYIHPSIKPLEQLPMHQDPRNENKLESL